MSQPPSTTATKYLIQTHFNKRTILLEYCFKEICYLEMEVCCMVLESSQYPYIASNYVPFFHLSYSHFKFWKCLLSLSTPALAVIITETDVLKVSCFVKERLRFTNMQHCSCSSQDFMNPLIVLNEPDCSLSTHLFRCEGMFENLMFKLYNIIFQINVIFLRGCKNSVIITKIS